MTASLQEIETEFEHTHPDLDLELIFAGSQTLATQIQAGAPADLFVSADLNQMQRVSGFREPTALIGNELVAVWSRSEIPENLAQAIERARRIVVAEEHVPAGHYTQRGLIEIGLWDQVKPKIVSYEHAVLGVVTKVALGEANLGFVYRTDAIHEQDRVRVVRFPEGHEVYTQTWITIRADLDHEGTGASRFYQYLRESQTARDIFVRHGFLIDEEGNHADE